MSGAYAAAVITRTRMRDHRLVTNAGSLLICGLLAGVLVAGATFPVAALMGVTAKTGGQAWAALPSELRDVSSLQVTYVYASDGKTRISQFFDELRSNVPLKEMSPYLKSAIVAAEDRNFERHNGVDLKGVARAAVRGSANGATQQGASTITMQYVRMSLTYSATNPQQVVDATARTSKRKITEMQYATEVEKQLSKDQILERYLNITPFGNRAYGVYAASQIYFNKKPKDLTVAQAAMLAGIVKAPSDYSPTTAAGHALILARRNNYVIPSMLEAGAITPAQAEAAKKEPIPRRVRVVGNGCTSSAKNNWGHFCEYFYRWWMSREEFGATANDRERRLKGGGYHIVTTLDIKGQDAARKRISERIGDRNQKALLLAGIEPKTGKVRVIAANRKYKIDDPDHPENGPNANPSKARKGQKGTYPNTTNPLVTGGGDIKGYQAGSVFKIFAIVAALEKGYPLATPINTVPRYRSKYIVDPGSSSACQGTHFWCPGGGGGIHNMWTGFGKSVNTYFVPLEEMAGAENVVGVAQRFGIKFREKKDAQYAATERSASQWGAFVLGVSASTPLDVASAYATLAGDGMYCQPTPIERITTATGEKLDVGKPQCTRATSKDVARAALDAARCPVGDSAQLGRCAGGTEESVRGFVGHPVFGKTGTTDGDRTAALVAGTTKLVVAGYLVNPDWQNHHSQMSHDVVNPAVYKTLGDFMRGKPRQQFKRPEDSKLSIGEQRTIPEVTCDSVAGARDRLEDAGFTVSVGRPAESDCPAGTVAGTKPSGRTIKGGFVTIEPSSGRKPEPTGRPTD
ncbi:penicillin-binding protein [Actinoplanes sp. NBRC 103695]|nr:penicillin-binding protein [Actinoplanes sp. NBRC 103695]